MKILPSKDLLSEVLGLKITKVCDEKEFGHRDNIIQLKYDNTLKLGDGSMAIARDNGHKSMNIYELAYKCKEWAYSNGFIVSSGINSERKWWADSIGVEEFPEVYEIFSAETEPEAIFKACEWILKDNK